MKRDLRNVARSWNYSQDADLSRSLVHAEIAIYGSNKSYKQYIADILCSALGIGLVGAATFDAAGDWSVQSARDLREAPLSAYLEDRHRGIEGTLVDERGVPISSALVEVFDNRDLSLALSLPGSLDYGELLPTATCRSDDQGRFGFRGLQYGPKTLFASKAGYVPTRIDDVVVADGSTNRLPPNVVPDGPVMTTIEFGSSLAGYHAYCTVYTGHWTKGFPQILRAGDPVEVERRHPDGWPLGIFLLGERTTFFVIEEKGDVLCAREAVPEIPSTLRCSEPLLARSGEHWAAHKFLGPCSKSDTRQGGTVRVKTQTPFGRVALHLRDPWPWTEAWCDAFGEVVIRDVPPGHSFVTTTMFDGALSYPRGLVVVEQRQAATSVYFADRRLAPQEDELVLLGFAECAGVPVANAQVALRWLSGTPFRSPTLRKTDEHGFFRVESLSDTCTYAFSVRFGEGPGDLVTTEFIDGREAANGELRRIIGLQGAHLSCSVPPVLAAPWEPTLVRLMRLREGDEDEVVHVSWWREPVPEFAFTNLAVGAYRIEALRDGELVLRQSLETP